MRHICIFAMKWQYVPNICRRATKNRCAKSIRNQKNAFLFWIALGFHYLCKLSGVPAFSRCKTEYNQMHFNFSTRIYRHSLGTACLLSCMTFLLACQQGKEAEPQTYYVDSEGTMVARDAPSAVEEAFPFSGSDVAETTVDDHGAPCIRIAGDQTISQPDKMTEGDSCFIVMSKKDYYLYVYQPQGSDTVMLARYDCCFSRNKGQKEREGDMRTPHCSAAQPFHITQIADASTWEHDFGDGRGPIKSYGNYFLRLETPGHKGIGIHGSTNNEESVPGRASEGCIRLHDDDIIDLAEHYAYVGMPVIIKAEEADDLPFEIHAMKKQQVNRLRHLHPQNLETIQK